MRSRWIGVGLLAGVMLALGCGGEAALGEECEVEGAEGECEEGAVCGKPDDTEAPLCLKVCEDQVDCAADEDCNGVSGTSIKGCRPKQ
jgi:hypothetical protein